MDDYSHYTWSFFTKKVLATKDNVGVFEKMMSHATSVKYLCCDNAEEHQSELQKVCEKEKNNSVVQGTSYASVEWNNWNNICSY